MRGIILGEGEISNILMKKFVKSLREDEKFVLFSFSNSAESKEELRLKLEKEGISLHNLISHFHIKEFLLSDLLAIFQQERIKRLLIGGSFNKLAALHLPISKKDHSSLANFFIQSLSKLKIELEDQLNYLNEYLCPHGILTKATPKAEDYMDIQYGQNIAKEIAKLGIGEAITIKKGIILAIEAIEGTDGLIERSGKLEINDFILIKVASPNQNTRWEVPAVGKSTVINLAESKGKILAVEADRVIFLDREESIRIADSKNLILMGI